MTPTHGTASRFLLAVSLLLLATAASKAETTVSTGVTGSDELLPFISLKLDREWTANDWVTKLKLNAIGEYDNAVGDAALDGEWHAETKFSNALFLELDAAYGVDREKTASIKLTHTLGGDIGVGYETPQYRIKGDIGAVVVLHENTTQAGFPSLDRDLEDFGEREAAVRLTLAPRASIQPFAEVAMMQRDYLIESERSFAGPEAVLGITVDNEVLTGDIGVIMTSRQTIAGKSNSVFGPYVDLKWSPQDDIEVAMALVSGIDQDTSGSSALFASHAARLELSGALSEDLKLSVVFDAMKELRPTGEETEFSPSINIAHSLFGHAGYFAAGGITFSKTEGERAEIEPKLEIGMNWTW